MPAHRIQLQNFDGSHSRWIGERELQQMVKGGEVTRISGRRDAVRAYRLKQMPEASTSRPTAATITIADARAMAGLQRVDEVWIERLVGLKLLPEGTPMPRRGYL